MKISNMKCLLLLLAVCIFYPAAKGFSFADVPDAETIMQSKCNQTGESAFSELQDAMKSFEETIFVIMPYTRDPSSEDFQKLCRAEAKSKLEKSFLRVVDKLKPCWSKHEQYMNKFLPQLFNDVMDQFCQGDDFDTLMEIFQFAMICYPAFKDVEEKCLNNMVLISNLKAGKFYWEKKELCKDIKFLQRCISSIKPCKFIFKEGIRILSQSPARWCN